jgi:hypothetical protein
MRVRWGGEREEGRVRVTLKLGSGRMRVRDDSGISKII